MGSITLDPKAIEQLSGERKALLDAIDSLRKHGIGRFVDLPQIIVVGDQSSGKSSVLEAISRVRFPVKDGLCTRFATELVLRTDSQTKVDVRVQSASVSTEVAYTFNETRFDKEDLPRIIEEAKSHLLRDSTAFSEDVLRVEISSPDVPHLTLVDLPGFYHSEDDNQSAAGREVVDRLVDSYMARKNSIILAIVSARNQVILQTVLSRVKAHDKNQERTLGIITKPDLLTPSSQEEDRFVRLARNQEKSHQLSLGWHVLRNRGETEDELSAEERDSKEQDFFDSGIWSAIPSSNRGVGTLRKKLANILLDHIRANLDTLIKDIEANMSNRQDRLRRLGNRRSSTPQLRAHLDKIASQFQVLALHAIEGHYSDEFFGGLYPDDPSSPMDETRLKKLRALVRDLNRTFTYVLATKGSRRIIAPGQNGGNKTDNVSIERHHIPLPSFLQVLESQYPFQDPQEVTREAIGVELEPLASANQGNEFPGTTNDLLAVKLFQDQSLPWEAISRCHIDFLLRVAKSFTERLVSYITGPDEKTCSAILHDIVDPFFEKRTVILEEKLQELLYHYRSGYPQPLDAEFRALMSKRQTKNLADEVVRDLLANRPELFTKEAQLQLASLSTPRRESEFGVDSLVDKSETYYELSLRTFIDNVIVLAVENCLIKDLPMILTTSMVSQMEEEELQRLAAESAEVQTERAELQNEYEALRKGLDLCKRYRARSSLVLPTFPSQPKTSSDSTSVSREELERSIDHLQQRINTLSTGVSQPPGTSPSSATGLFATSGALKGSSISSNTATKAASNTATNAANNGSTSGTSLFGNPSTKSPFTDIVTGSSSEPSIFSNLKTHPPIGSLFTNTSVGTPPSTSPFGSGGTANKGLFGNSASTNTSFGSSSSTNMGSFGNSVTTKTDGFGTVSTSASNDPTPKKPKTNVFGGAQTEAKNSGSGNSGSGLFRA